MRKADQRRRAAPQVSRDEWIQAALDARVEQGLPEEIEDPEVLDFLADIFAKAQAVQRPERCPRK